MRVIYFCPSALHPFGGVKVIYRHCEVLKANGVKACIMPAIKNHDYPWASRTFPLVDERDIRQDDFFLVSEINAASVANALHAAGLKYGIFVQGGYCIHRKGRKETEKDIESAYRNAQIILSISDDTSDMVRLYFPFAASKIRRVSCSIDSNLFYPGRHKQNLITYMPRRMGDDYSALIFALKRRLPSEWEIHAINGVSPEKVAEALRASKIFLSFSHLEGLGLPPAEAALCGNYVIGYHGQGGKGHWLEPNFCEVYPGDIRSFVTHVLSRVEACSESQSGIDSALVPGIRKLEVMFSRGREVEGLMTAVKVIREVCPKTAESKLSRSPVKIRIQKSGMKRVIKQFRSWRRKRAVAQ